MVTATSIRNWEQVKNLLGEIKRTPERVPWWQIRRYAGQPRKVFEAITALGGCLAALGQLDPVKIRPLTPRELDEIKRKAATGEAKEKELLYRYELIDGERRHQAAEEQYPHGSEDPCAVLDCVLYHIEDEKLQFLISVASNFGRQQHKPMEAARSFGRLRDELHMKPAEVARFVGLDYQYVLGMMRLLELHPDLQEMVEDGKLGASVGKALAGIEKDRQGALLARVQRTGPVTANRVKTAIDVLLHGTPESRNPNFRKRTRAPSDFRDILERALKRTAIQFGDMSPGAIGSAVETGMARRTLDYAVLVGDGVKAARNLLQALAAIPADGNGTLELALVEVLGNGLAQILDLEAQFYAGLGKLKAGALQAALERIEKLTASVLVELRKVTGVRAPPSEAFPAPAAKAPKPPVVTAPRQQPPRRPPPQRGAAGSGKQPAKKPGKPSPKLRGGLDGGRRARS